MRSSGSRTTSRRRSGDLRVKSGCWKCRERRVKCPEQRPVCGHCQRLGFACHYEIRLSWQPPTAHQRGSPFSSCGRRYHHLVEEWMFLNTAYDDFEKNSATAPDSWLSLTPAKDGAHVFASPHSATITHQYRSPCGSLSMPCPSISPRPSLLSLSDGEARLWDYFNVFIAPRCVMKDGFNPYRQTIMRVAASSPGGPVFQSILAVSAHQMQVLKHAEPPANKWTYRNRALESLRKQVSEYSDLAPLIDTSSRVEMAQQIVASTLMMCFFEILHDCSEAWKIHAAFARSFLTSTQVTELKSNGEFDSLYKFAAAYIIYHDVLAFTAGTQSEVVVNANDQLLRLVDEDDPTFVTLTGCSKRLVGLLSDITNLATSQTSNTLQGISGHRNGDESASLTERRRGLIERELYHIQHPSVRTLPDVAADETTWIAELKRLTSLMYLYARIDGYNPSHPIMIRLTNQILRIIPKISLRTNTILWPLFTVAILGVRSESDDDRRLVLEKLQSLQETRQLGNVKKAIRIIHEVWKARDLTAGDFQQGWSILEGRFDTISLA